MIRRHTTVCNRRGLHARAAAKFVTLAAQFDSEVHLTREGQWVNGKSIMGIMMLAACQGACVELCVSGPDEEEAAAKLLELVERGFDEAE